MAVLMNKKPNKDKKADIYYYDGNIRRHINTRNKLWCSIRDTSPSEKLTYIDIQDKNEASVVIYLNYNKRLLDLWKHGEQTVNTLFCVIHNRTYVIVGKPDEYEHNKTDLKVLATERMDNESTSVSVDWFVGDDE